MKNRSLFGEKWTEITFSFKYNLTHENVVESMDNQGYEEFRERVNYFDFIKIKSIGTKVYEFFASDAEFELKAEGRLLDLDDYDDVLKIKLFYYGKVAEYDHMVDSIKDNQMFIDLDKETYESNSDMLNIWKERLTNILDEMTSDEDDSEEEINSV